MNGRRSTRALAATSSSALPSASTGLRPDRLGFASTHDTSVGQGPSDPATSPVMQVDRKATSNVEATSSPVKSPRRYLDPELARAIKEAKLKTGASWRRVAKYTGLSHSYLVQLSNGQRVPSRHTVEVLAKVLPMEEWAVEALRREAGI